MDYQYLPDVATPIMCHAGARELGVHYENERIARQVWAAMVAAHKLPDHVQTELERRALADGWVKIKAQALDERIQLFIEAPWYVRIWLAFRRAV